MTSGIHIYTQLNLQRDAVGSLINQNKQQKLNLIIMKLAPNENPVELYNKTA